MPVFVHGTVKIATLMSALASSGLRLRFDTYTGRFVIDDKPIQD